jgi:hypothetical protein
MPPIDSPIWHFLEHHIYNKPFPPPKTRIEPMEVLCVYPPRSATEYLQHTLLKFGYDYTFHGWNIMFKEPYSMQGWVRLARKEMVRRP